MIKWCRTWILLALTTLTCPLAGQAETHGSELNDANAFYRLAQQYRRGDHQPQDLQQAATWFLMAAVQGHKAAQFHLANAYHSGNGVPQLHKRAVYWWRRAAEQGHPAAQFKLGRALLNGNGVAIDREAARSWLRQAQQNGYLPASALLEGSTGPSPAPSQLSLSRDELAAEPAIIPSAQSVAAAPPAQEPEPKPEPVPEPQSAPAAEEEVIAQPSPHQPRETDAVAPALREECRIWLAQAPEQGFTIQMIATHRLSSVMTYIERHKLEGNYSLCAYDEYNALWFAIFYGHYDSLSAARAGLKALPDSLKRNKPYFRNLNKMRQLVRQHPVSPDNAD